MTESKDDAADAVFAGVWCGECEMGNTGYDGPAVGLSTAKWNRKAGRYGKVDM